MLQKGIQDYQETMNAWKQIPHIMKLFAEEEVSASMSLLSQCVWAEAQSFRSEQTRSCAFLLRSERELKSLRAYSLLP